MLKDTAQQIVIVEDSLELVESLAEYLKTVTNFRINYFTKGQSFLTYWRNNANSIALIILDLNLPDGKGDMLLPTIKRSNFNTKVIVLTANDSDLSMIKLYSMGVDDYLVKPVTFSVLGALIKRRLKESIDNFSTIKSTYNTSLIKLQNFELNVKTGMFTNKENGMTVFMSKRSKDLLKVFIKQQDSVLHWEMIEELFPDITNKRVFSVWVSRLNKKLKIVAGDNLIIKSYYNVGYKLIITK